MPDSPTTDDRLLAAIRAIIRAEFPRLTYTGVFEYAIQSVTGSGASATVDASPTDTTIPLPDITGCPLAPIVGATCKPVPGTLALVLFLNADPTRPLCISMDASPLTLTLDGVLNTIGATGVTKLGLGALPVARGTDLAAGIFPVIPTQFTVLA